MKTKIHLQLSTLAAIVLLSISTLGAQVTWDPAAFQAALDAVYNDTNNNWKAGLSAAIIYDGQTWTGAAGFASIDSATAMTPAHATRYYSSTKTFTAALILELANEGRLSLDDTLGKWVTGLTNPNINQAATIRQLLTHRTGFPDYTNEQAVILAVVADPTRIWDPLEVMNNTNYVKAPLFPLGTNYRYSSTNYVLLGLVINGVLTNDSVESAFRSRFLDSAGLSSVSFPPAEALRAPLATAHDNMNRFGLSASTAIVTVPLPLDGVGSIAWTTGALIGTAQDLAKWTQALYTADVVDPKTVDSMFASIQNAANDDDPGYGIYRDEATAMHVVGHGGASAGYRSLMAWDTVHKIAIAVTTNQGVGSLTRASRALHNVLMGVSSRVDAEMARAGIALGSPYPNPSLAQMTIPIQAAKPTHALISIVSLGGQLLRTETVMLEAGSQLHTLDLSDLAAGTYMVRLEAPGTTQVRPIVKH